MTGPAFDRVVDALREAGRQVKMVGPGMARSSCPAHDGDNKTALSIMDTADRVNLHCFTQGCDGADVLAAIGLTIRDRYHEPRGDNLASYAYPDGFTITRKMGPRQDGKDFRASTGWTGKLRPLYRRERIAEAIAAGRSVLLVEGEEDVHAVEAAYPDAVATSAPHGASNFDKADIEPLRGADVVAIVDQDANGEGDRWAESVRVRLEGVAKSVRFVRAASGKDMADHLAAGYGLADLVACQTAQNAPQGDDATQDDDLPASWAPVDLGPILDGTHRTVEPTLLPRSDGVCLVYPGLTHSFHCESESGKSLVCQIEAVRLLNAGQRVLFVDFESDAASVVGRLLEFGAALESVRDRFVYLRPEVRPDASVRELSAWLDVLSGSFALAVVDGVTDSLGIFGYSTKDNDDVTRWARALPRRIADRTGAAVVLVDHVTKDADSRGRFAIGGQAKLSGLTGAAYTVEVSKPLGRGLRGVIVLRIGKDRPGHIRGHGGPMRASDRTQEVARVVVDSTGPAPSVTVEPWQARGDEPGAAGRWRPTGIMERLSRYLESAPEPVSFRTLDVAVSGKADHKRTALAELESDGCITVTDGPRGAKLHASERPYRQADDPASDLFEPRDTLDPLDHPESASNECVTVSRPYTGTRDTHTQPFLTVSGTQSGHSRDTVENGPTEAPENLPDAPSAPGRTCDCGQPLAAGKARCDDCRRRM